MLKLNIDVVVKVGFAPIEIGVMIRNDQSGVVATLSRSLLGAFSANLSEFLALKERCGGRPVRNGSASGHDEVSGGSSACEDCCGDRELEGKDSCDQKPYLSISKTKTHHYPSQSPNRETP
ncbi:hypothetical protein LWI29_028715 [Acer saccharum]|uniref:Uncharacterized protein n=1 Tax=Acer saccharum TaxID=4024 RepID=A0AA39VPE4_ACESA|nr:hypothetical protein LWI29_028715 [Acer saccharum]